MRYISGNWGFMTNTLPMKCRVSIRCNPTNDWVYWIVKCPCGLFAHTITRRAASEVGIMHIAAPDWCK